VQTFGEALARLRGQAGLGRDDLAQAAHVSQSWINRTQRGEVEPDDATVRLLDIALNAGGQLVAAHEAAEADSVPSLMTPPSDPADLAYDAHRTDVGSDTVEQLNVAVEQLCCEYVSCSPQDLRDDAHHQLDYVQRLVAGSTTLKEQRDLLVVAGWLTLLIGCVNYDMGLARQAETARATAIQLGREAGHSEIVGWAFELSAWFAITQGRLRSVSDFAEAGINAAPHASVAVQLAAQAAKAHARMGNKSEVRHELDKGFRLLAAHEHPSHPENHFVIDPDKWDFYAMDCYLMVGENKRATEHAHSVLELSERPDGTDKSPMRASEARLALATVALRDGDLDNAAEWLQKGFTADRKSLGSLRLRAEEIHREARQRYGDDPSLAVINHVISEFYASARDS
jgi:transcriptional regulator with XRE-family HTH domain